MALTAAERRLLLGYLEVLDRWNRGMNLTSLGPDARVRRLVAEPLWVATQLRPAGHYLDIGTGNGSPAVPWCMHCGFSSCEFVESRARRAVFLEFLVRKLPLERCVVHTARFPEAQTALRPPDWVTLQGVRLDAALLRRIRSLNPDARVVWLSRGPALPEPPARRLQIPGSDREALVFGPPPPDLPSGRA